MKTYTIYDKNTGQILVSGICAHASFKSKPRNSNEAVMEGLGNDVTQKVVDGKIVNKTPQEMEP